MDCTSSETHDFAIIIFLCHQDHDFLLLPPPLLPTIKLRSDPHQSSVVLEKSASKEEINKALHEASQTYLKGILGYTEEELVSQDFMGSTESSFIDAKLTNVIGQTAKIISWYDNEVGFSHRVLDLATFMGSQF